MKIFRYVMIAVFVYLLLKAGRSFLSPVVSLLSPDSFDLPISPDFRSIIQMALLPWIAFFLSMLVGWLFLSKKTVVYSAIAIATPLLGYLVITSFNKIGFTTVQSFSAITRGHGTAIMGWVAFYLVALVSLFFAAWRRANEADRAEA